jgi:hypothetical protein
VKTGGSDPLLMAQGFHLRSVTGIPGLKSETWGTLRFVAERTAVGMTTCGFQIIRVVVKEPQVPPLRFAPVGMTKERVS